MGLVLAILTRIVLVIPARIALIIIPLALVRFVADERSADRANRAADERPFTRAAMRHAADEPANAGATRAADDCARPGVALAPHRAHRQDAGQHAANQTLAKPCFHFELLSNRSMQPVRHGCRAGGLHSLVNEYDRKKGSISMRIAEGPFIAKVAIWTPSPWYSDGRSPSDR